MIHNHPRRLLLAALLLAISAGAIVAYIHHSRPAPLLQLDGATMGTSYQLLLPALPQGMDRQSLAEGVQARLDRLDREIFSTWQPDSELSRFNRHPVDEPFEASPELVEAVLLGQEVHRLSGGAFDITVGPLTDLWGFGPVPGPAFPDEAQVARARDRVDSRAVHADRERSVLLKSAPVQLDMAGIAKGYSVDQVADWLAGLGVRNYLLEVGGELRAAGLREPGKPWRIAIEAPLTGPRQAFSGFGNGGAPIAAAGSGDYRNVRESSGKRFSHELDPRTGRPARHALAAATVIDASAGRADALATALMVLGPREGFSLAAGLGLAAYFIIRGDDGTLRSRHTAAFAPYLDAWTQDPGHRDSHGNDKDQG